MTYTMDRKLLFLAPLLFFAASPLKAADAGKPDRSAAPAGAGQPGKSVRLKSEVFAPTGDVEGNLARIRARHGNRPVVHVIVQFDELPDDARRRQLEAHGVKLLGYLPDNAFFAAVPARVKGGDLQAARLRWLGAVYADDKVPERIRTQGLGVWALRAPGKVDVRVSCFADVNLNDVSAAIAGLGGELIEAVAELHRITVTIPTAALNQVTALDEVRWVEEVPPPPKPQNDGSRLNVQADIVQSSPYDLSGSGVVLGIWDGGSVDPNHDDFVGRITLGEAGTPDDHATHVAGTMAGSGALSVARGGTAGQWRGMAPAARMVSYDFYGNVITEHNPGINTHGIVLSQNSWGFVVSSLLGNCSLYGNYSMLAPEFDAIVTGLYGRGINVVFAAGNERSSGDCGLNNGPPNYVNYRCIGPPATAKNIISVGAINSDDNTITEFTSWGPVDDGRLKPDLVAPGCEAGGEGFIKSTLPGDSYGNSLFCGTSMAAPAVSGVIALLTENYRSLFGTNPTPSTIKGLLLHTAADLNDATPWYNKGPDYASGYGRVQAQAAVDQLRTSGFLTGNVGHGETNSYLFNLPPGSTEVKLTLVWDDPAGQENAAVALVNDLDLIVHDPQNARRFPWTLDPGNPAAAAAANAEDHLNVVEQVLVDAGVVAGGWRVSIAGRSVPGGRQAYTLVYSIPQPVVAAATHTLVAETCGSGNNAPDPFEVVTMDFGLRNVGALATSDLIATLLPSANVLSPSGPQTVGVLPAQGGAATARFTFKTAGECGAVIPVQFQLQDGAEDLGILTFNVRLGTQRFSLSEGFDQVSTGNLPAGWTATLTGSGVAWTVAGNGTDGSTNAAFCPDPSSASDNRLTSPPLFINSPQAQLTFRHSYNTHTGDRGTLQISINGAPFTNVLAVGGAFASGGYTGSGWSGNSQGYVTVVVNLPGHLAGQTVQFQWRFTTDATTGGAGWYVDSISLKDGFECCNPEGLLVTVSGWPSPTFVESNLTYTITVANASPSSASGVKLTNILGSTLTFLSAIPSQGTVTRLGTEVACDIGNLAAGASALVTIQTRANVEGFVTNVATVYGNEADPEPLNNFVTTVTRVNTPIVPDLIVVDARGPAVGSTGGSIVVTNEVMNVGLSNAVLTFRINFYLSADLTITTNDVFLGSRSIFGLAASQSTIANTPASIPVETEPGVYYLGAIVDFNEQVIELNESNNSFVAGTMQVVVGPDMIVTAVAGPAAAAIGGTIALTNTVRNIGTGNPGYFSLGYYLSTDSTITTNDTRVAAQLISGLAPGASSTGSVSAAISSSFSPGLYYLGAIADFNHAVLEQDENNNAFLGTTMQLTLGVDLTMQVVSGPTNAATGNAIAISNIVQNVGANNATAFSIGFYLSQDSVIGTNDQRFGARNVTSLAAGQRSTNITTLTIPVTNRPGVYYLGAIADYPNALPEASETNNARLANAIEIVIGPDLVMTNLSGPSRGSPGGTMQVTNVVANIGPGDPGAFVIGIYLSPDPIVTTNDLRMAVRGVANLAPGASSTGVTAVAIAANFTNFGTYYLGAIADYGSLIPEISESNNVMVAPMTVEIGRAYDFVVGALSSPTNTYTGGILVISNRVQNIGLDNAPASVLGFYLSPDPIITTNDVRIGTRNVPAIPAGGHSTTNSSITIAPTNLPGIYYLGAIADYTSVLPETSETNNWLAGNQLVLNIGPDLEAIRVTGPITAAQSASAAVTTVIKNVGLGDPGAFNVGIYLSPDPIITTNDYRAGLRAVGSLAPGISSTGITTVTITNNLPSGQYYWGTIADYAGVVREITRTNNAQVGGTVQVNPAIDLIVSFVGGPAGHCTGNPFILTNVVSNIGTANSPTFDVGLYLSLDDEITTDDILMWVRTVSSLAVGRSETNFMSLVNLGGLDPGPYYFGVIVDPGGKITEMDEGNNARLGNFHEVTLGPDLVVNDIICQAFASQGTTIPVTSIIQNQGCGNAPQSFTVGVYLSTDPLITTGDTRLGGRTINTLGIGAISTGTVSVALSATLPSATYYIGVIADDGNRIYESVETNNVLLGTPVVIRPAADLVMEDISGPTNACTGSSIIIRNTVVNNGTDNAGSFAVALYLSADTNITTADLRLGSRTVASLPPGQTNGASTTLALPLTLTPGTYFVGAIADYLNALPESEETNNATPGNLIEIAIGPELIMTAVTGPAAGAQGSTISITNAVSNAGCGDIPTSIIGLYLSTDPIITTSDIRVGTRSTPTMLPGVTSTGVTTVTLSATLPSATYYLGAIADYNNTVVEGSEGNNSLTGLTIEIQPGIDLIVESAEGPANASTGMTISITNLLRNVGTAGVGPFSVGVFISTNDIIATNDIRIGTNSVPGLAAGQSITNVTTFVIANTISAGLYYLGLIADDLSLVPETDETNNILSIGLIEIVLGPDLVVTSITGPASAPVGGSLNVTSTVVNVGSGQANIGFRVAYYLSTDNVITTNDTLVGFRFINSVLGGQTNTAGIPVQLPTTLPAGSYYMGGYVDYQFRVPESIETNNVLAGYPFEVLPLRMTTVRVEGADVVISFETVTARSYRLQQSDTLNGPWTTVTGAASLSGTGGVVTFRHTGGVSAGRRFYRLQLL
jgi:uncharacterized repeat protein (TIGR01451 family)